MIPGQLQQCRTLQRGPAATAEGFLEAGGQFGRGEIRIGGRHDERGAGQDAQDLRDALARLEQGDATGREVTVIGDAIAGRGEIGIALGGGDAAAHGLHFDNQIDEIFDGRLVFLQRHGIGQRERKSEAKFGLGEPAVEVVPAQPARDRVGIGADKEHALPRHKNVVEPHLAVELVIAQRQRRDERVGLTRRRLAAEDCDAGRPDRHDKAGTFAVDVDARHAADINVLGIGGARMHAEPAANDETGVRLAHKLQRDAVGGVGLEALADDRRAAAIGNEAAGARDYVAIGERVIELLLRDILRLHGGQDAECDQIAVGRVVRDVAGAEERRARERPAHADQIFLCARDGESPGRGIVRVGRREQHVPPFGIPVTVVPGGVFLDNRARRGMPRHILDGADPHDPELAPVAQRLAVFGAGAHQLFGGGGVAAMVLTRRGASGAAGMLPTSISGIGMSIARSTALANSL